MGDHCYRCYRQGLAGTIIIDRGWRGPLLSALSTGVGGEHSHQGAPAQAALPASCAPIPARLPVRRCTQGALASPPAKGRSQAPLLKGRLQAPLSRGVCERPLQGAPTCTPFEGRSQAPPARGACERPLQAGWRLRSAGDTVPPSPVAPAALMQPSRRRCLPSVGALASAPLKGGARKRPHTMGAFASAPLH